MRREGTEWMIEVGKRKKVEMGKDGSQKVIQAINCGRISGHVHLP